MTRRQNFAVLKPNEREAIKNGFELMADVVAQDQSIRDWILLVPQLGSLQHTSLSAVLGDALTKALQNGQQLTLNGVTVRLETTRTLRSYTQADAVVAIYSDQRMMDLLDSNRGLRVIVAIPSQEGDIDSWIRTWSPIIPGRSIVADPLIQDSVVVAALKSLTARVNLSNRILNPSDAEATIGAFRVLRANDHSVDPAMIRAWCIRNGWDPAGADEAMKHATKAFNSKSRAKLRDTHWAPDIYQQWKTSKR